MCIGQETGAMVENYQRPRPAGGKRQVLIADDEFVSRELLKAVLQSDYKLLFATDGQEALDVVHDNKDTLSLILLDLMMPSINGMDLLMHAKHDAELAKIPIIVISADQNSEAECLRRGAIDFIPKPYPQPAVILARVNRTIELSEDRQIISSTERDPLTGLYTREYFYRYAEQYDQHNKSLDMDAIVLDVNHFRLINERFGAEYGDSVLRGIGDALKVAARECDGIAGRLEADTFLLYCPHRMDFDHILESTSTRLTHGGGEESRIWLRMGVYALVDKSLDVADRFKRAKMACDAVTGSFTQRIGFYNSDIQENQLFSERLIEDFDAGIRAGQFVVHYQPKFDIQADVPTCVSGEALVRWNHPELGVIMPDTFIPLFEENGLIQRLDLYVWRKAAAQIGAWKRELGFAVPISINMSRIDMYDPHMIDTLLELVESNGLNPHELLIEVTESAYIQDSDQILDTANKLRELGFRIEMDDFGRGYSPLSMISSLPLDGLKLDMQSMASAFAAGGDTRMVEIIIDIADYLDVPVIAEGVETADQLFRLREMGCTYAQGNYFSEPLPIEEFERYVLERKRARELELGDSQDEAATTVVDDRLGAQRKRAITYASIIQALTVDYVSIYYVDMSNNSFIEYSSRAEWHSFGLERSGEDFFSQSHANALKVIHPEDREMFIKQFTKENVLQTLEHDKTFTLSYRLIFDGEPFYVMLKATRMGDSQDHHVVIGVSDINEQAKREQEHDRAMRLANQDQLTGVKSKHAYAEAEQKINRAIETSTQAPFAVAVCDINGLKVVNDTQGHAAGDQFIKDACAIVCNVFKHSPVFRIGGDEFVVILSGSDYEARDILMSRLENSNRINLETGGVSVAGGLSTWQPETDDSLDVVFKRADARMYEDKKRIKEVWKGQGVLLSRSPEPHGTPSNP